MSSYPDSERNQQVPARPPSAFGRLERMPPLFLAAYVAMGGVSALFLVLIAAYVSVRLRSGIPTGLYALPRYFSLSTLVLLLSSYTVGQAARLYAADDLRLLSRCLVATLLLGAIFAGLQLLGWYDLYRHGVPFQGQHGRSSGQFVYLISGLHVAHLLGGMLFMLALLLRVLHTRRDAIRSLVFIRNPYHRWQIRLLTTYWHFIGVLWLVLFGVFLFFF